VLDASIQTSSSFFNGLHGCHCRCCRDSLPVACITVCPRRSRPGRLWPLTRLRRDRVSPLPFTCRKVSEESLDLQTPRNGSSKDRMV
jgi:hypothetical protein